jgi:hypothetical protein
MWELQGVIPGATRTGTQATRGAARDTEAKRGRRLGSRDLRLHQLGGEESMTPETVSLSIWSEPSDHLVVTVALPCHSP